MFSIVSDFCYLMYYCLIDFVIFVFVDIFVKLQIKDASNEWKKRIWLFESACLFVICIMCYFHHVPYLLSLLTVFTFGYTQLCGRDGLKRFLNNVQTRWDEYKQHEESLGHIQEHHMRQKQVTAVSPPNVNYLPYYQQLQPGGIPASIVHSVANNSAYSVSQKPIQSKSEWFYSLPGTKVSQQEPKFDQLIQNQQHSEGSFLTQRRAGGSVNDNVSTSAKPYWFGGESLTRRPLHEHISTHIPKPLDQPSSTRTSVRSKFMRAFGLNKPSDLPPGLKNHGMNLCFMNAVLQSLARSPHLVSCLTIALSNNLQCGIAESVLLSSLSDLLQQCSLPPGHSSAAVLDTSSFRKAAASLNSTLVAQVGHMQEQQDAAEFLMWLLDTVHTVLNHNKQPGQNDKVPWGLREKGFSMTTLSMLKFIYGDLNHAKLNDLKDACKTEIKNANGLENDSYAEPIQRLSDLEWLTHKQNNESIIDDLFTGQLVEAYHSLSNNNISVNLQAFNVLPVPIATPRQVSGVVFLEDCFTSFCHIEQLFGNNGIYWEQTDDAMSNQRRGFSNPVTHSTPKSQIITRSSNMSSTSGTPTSLNPYMSPIPSTRDTNDSGFHDHMFRTSTPILDVTSRGGSNVVIPKQQGEIQRRCLLRQLPECLIIQLMRFSFSQKSGCSKKIKSPVSIRLKKLDLSHIIFDTVTNREDLTAANHGYCYDLYSVCVHLGAESTHNGHYVTYALHNNGIWYRFDDENVTEVNMDYEVTTKELRENAYILFYRRCARS